METQQDFPIRVAALHNLRAMCQWSVTRASRSRGHVTYTYPRYDNNGYQILQDGNTMFVLPCHPSRCDNDDNNPRVVLGCIRVFGDPDGEEEMYYNPATEIWHR